MLLSSIINNPEFYFKLKDKLSEDVFITDFNRRVYSSLSQRLDGGRSIELSMLSADFTPQENGRLAKFIAMKKEISSTLGECEDCINVMKQEKAKQNAVNPADTTPEEFLNLFRKKS